MPDTRAFRSTFRSRVVATGAAAAGLVLVQRAVRRSRAISFRGRVVLVSGGSRGLGLVLARELAAEGARLVLTARNEVELARAREQVLALGAEVAVVPGDMGDRQQAERAVEIAVNRFGRLDVLVNNAGLIQVGPLDNQTIADFERAMAIHFWAPLYLTLAALPHMRRARFGRIVNVTSIGGKVAVPHLLPYTASKFALVGLSDGLRAELAREGIRVTTVTPGLMRTGSPFNAWFKGRHRGEFAWFTLLDSMPVLSIDARRAARKTVEACRHGDPSLIITPQARIASVVNELLPGMTATLSAWVNRVLPPPSPESGSEARSGWQSGSRLVPSWATTLTNRAGARNNQLPE